MRGNHALHLAVALAPAILSDLADLAWFPAALVVVLVCIPAALVIVDAVLDTSKTSEQLVRHQQVGC